MPRSRLYEIARFVLVGGACFVLDYGLLYILTEYVGLYYLLSAGISFSVSVFVNYWLCLACVFRGCSDAPCENALLRLEHRGARAQSAAHVAARRLRPHLLHDCKTHRRRHRYDLELCSQTTRRARSLRLFYHPRHLCANRDKGLSPQHMRRSASDFPCCGEISRFAERSLPPANAPISHV